METARKNSEFSRKWGMSLGKRYMISSYNNMQDLTCAGMMGKSRKGFKFLSEVI